MFCESTVSDTAMRQVASATGAEMGGTLHVDSLRARRGGPHLHRTLEHDLDPITKGRRVHEHELRSAVDVVDLTVDRHVRALTDVPSECREAP